MSANKLLSAERLAEIRRWAELGVRDAAPREDRLTDAEREEYYRIIQTFSAKPPAFELLDHAFALQAELDRTRAELRRVHSYLLQVADAHPMETDAAWIRLNAGVTETVLRDADPPATNQPPTTPDAACGTCDGSGGISCPCADCRLTDEELGTEPVTIDCPDCNGSGTQGGSDE